MLRKLSRAVVAALLAVSVGTTASRAAEPAGTVTAISGHGLAEAGGRERPLANGDGVRNGDTVRTERESRMSLRLGRATAVHLGPKTRLRIEPHLAEAGGELELVEGGFVYDHAQRTGERPERSEVRSPYGLIAVRGTRFFAGETNGRFGIFVAEGRVDVSAGGRTVRLTPGLGTDFARVGDAPSRPRKWSEIRISRAWRSVTGTPFTRSRR